MTYGCPRRWGYLIFLAGAFFLPFGQAAIETDGALDPTFDAGTFASGQVSLSVLQPDGKVLIGGYFNKVNGVTRTGIARLLADGRLDTDFNPASDIVRVYSLVVQDDGKIITVGAGQSHNVCRLNSDGSIDSTFNIDRAISNDGADDGAGNATSHGYVKKVFLQSDGKVIVAGNFFYVVTGPGTKVARSCIARFNSDGSFDSSFNPGGGADASGYPQGYPFVSVVLAQKVGPNAGKLIVAGGFDQFDGHYTSSGFVRLNSDGSYDSTFSVNEISGVYFEGGSPGTGLQSDDKILIWGNFGSTGGAPTNGLVRLNSSGAVDTSFTTEAFTPYNGSYFVSCVAQQSDGRLLVGGSFHALGNALANNLVRLESNGAKDSAFNSTNATGPSANSINTVSIASDGMIFVGGDFSTYNNVPRGNIAWVSPNGAVDSTREGLASAVIDAPYIYALASQPDGKILVGGYFSGLNDKPHYNIVRLNSDATIDSSFDPTLGTSGSVHAILVQPDGKIVIGGYFQFVNGVPRSRVARLNSDGTLDATFYSDRFLDGPVNALTQDASGSIYAAGRFDYPAYVTALGVEKLAPTGATDTAFDVSRPSNGSTQGFYGSINAISLDQSGGLILGGGFTSYRGFSCRGLARVNATSGEFDPQFNNNSSGFSGTARALARDSTGKYYVAGSSVVRVLSNGSRDTAFRLIPSLYGTYAVALQTSGILASGVGDTYYGISPFVRYDSGGNQDPSLITGGNFSIIPGLFGEDSNTVYLQTLCTQADGRLLVGGQFTQYNGVRRISLARLTDSRLAALKINSISRMASGAFILRGTGKPYASYVVEVSQNLNSSGFVSTGNVTCDSAGSWQFTDTSPPNAAESFYRLTLSDGATPSQSKALLTPARPRK